MKNKTSVTSSLSNKGALTDAEINAGFGFNTILTSPDLNGQLYDIDSQVDIITKEICNFLTNNGVTLNSGDNSQLYTLLNSMFSAKQNSLTAGTGITIDENGVISAQASTPANIPLFYCAWLDSYPYNVSWVNANNYSWLYASTYVGAYDRLDAQLNPVGTFSAGDTYYVCNFSDGSMQTTTVLAGSGTLAQLEAWCSAQGYTYSGATIEELECYKTLSPSSETINGITVTYYLTNDGKKIITSDAEIANAESIYNSTGVAWYYIMDTVNQRFKLPRTKWGFTGLRDKVGKYVPETLPNIKGEMELSHVVAQGFSGALSKTSGSTSNYGHDSGYTTNYIHFNAHDSNTAYQDSAPVQQRATQMYLYFYLGSTDVEETAEMAGIKAETINNKADLDLNNVSTTSGFRRLIEVYNNGTDWYKVYEEYDPSDGSYIGKWCEQGGLSSISGNDTTNVINLKKTLVDYTVAFPTATATSNMGYHTSIYAWLYSNNQLNLRREANSGVGTGNICWKVEGYVV